VPFTWTLRLAAPWAVVNGVLLGLFWIFDWRAAAGRPAAMAEARHEPLSISGRLNALWLLGIVLTVIFAGAWGPTVIPDGHARAAVQTLCMLVFVAASLLTTPREIHRANRFTWAPLTEVAVVFVGVFLTMVPALQFLEERGTSLGVSKPWQFFWAAGLLSGVLDNAPTYLAFASLATGVADQGAGLLSAANLGPLAWHPIGRDLLEAVACGSVFMGAVTYLGNAPNLMVKAIAEQHQVRMPSFFGYLLWSGTILLPLFGLVSCLFF
jgi:Na+/H+ antiporter NhaD/arsenite permease-like protein